MNSSNDYDKNDELEQIYNHAPIGLCVFDLQLRYKRINYMLATMGGYTIEEHIGESVFKIIPQLGKLVENVTQQVLVTKRPVLDVNVTGATAKRPDILRTYRWSCYPLFDADNNVNSFTFIVEDDTDKQLAKIQLIDSEKRFREMADKAPLMIWISNEQLQYTYFSRGWYEYIGLDPDTIQVCDIGQYVHPDDYGQWISSINRAYSLEQSFMVEHRLLNYDGSYRWFTSKGLPQSNDHGRFVGFIGSTIDIHDLKTAEVQLRAYKVEIEALNKSLKFQVEKRTQELKRLALYNIHTNLPNRNGLNNDVSDLMKSLKTSERSNFAILVVDMTNYAEIIDFFGRSTADQLLLEVADTLKCAIASSGDLYHLDGDKFAIIIKGLVNRNELQSILDSIIQRLDQGWLIDENIIYCNPCIGACVFDNAYDCNDALIAHADMALSIAKKDGKSSVIFEPEMEEDLRSRILITKDLRRAVKFDQFFLLYQPQFNAESGKMSGIEALIRWNHPTEGIKKPYEFIPLAEHSRVIVEIGNWVVRECCAQLNNWARSGIEAPPLSVNISPYQLRNQSQFIEFLKESLHEFRIPAKMLEIEITENALLDLPDRNNNILHKIKQLGMRISLDDFGTGYASLDYLSKFPVDRIKIAQNFVSDVIESPRNKAIIEATVLLANKLDVEVIVEGVETREQLHLLSSLGCKEFQGYYFSEPISARLIGEMLISNN